MKFLAHSVALFTLFLTGCCTTTPTETIPISIAHITVRAVKKDAAGNFVDLPGYSATLIGSGGVPVFAKTKPVVPGGTTLAIPADDIRPTPQDPIYPAHSYLDFTGDANQGAPVGITKTVYLMKPIDQEFDFVFDLPTKTVSIHHHKL